MLAVLWSGQCSRGVSRALLFSELLGLQRNSLHSLFDSYEPVNFNLCAVVGMVSEGDESHSHVKSVPSGSLPGPS